MERLMESGRESTSALSLQSAEPMGAWSGRSWAAAGMDPAGRA